ncbi:MAG TPA: hypothetical protein VFC21_11130, partial [Bryobacteraceae bacterium]|nr:hypothetical protein [Bryobacteraceae bacterium]
SLANTGLIEIDGGAVLAVDGRLKNDGILIGTGAIVGNLLNNGIDNPGGLGTQTVAGNYDQTAAGMLVLDFASDDSLGLLDSLGIAGRATLAGTLEIDFVDGFTAVAGDRFTILTAFGGVFGNFDTFHFASLAPGLAWTEQVNGDEVQLDVVGTAPEPSTFALLLPTLLGVAWWSSRRRRKLIG